MNECGYSHSSDTHTLTLAHTHASMCMCFWECIAAHCLAPSCMQHDLRVSIVATAQRVSCCTFCVRLLFICRTLPFRTLTAINIRQCNTPSPQSRALRLTNVALMAAAQGNAGDSSFQVLFAATFIAIFTNALECIKDHSSIVHVPHKLQQLFLFFEFIFQLNSYFHSTSTNYS